MSAESKIEWCDSTLNPWIGCTKVSPGCDNCYAEREWDIRRHRVRWGAGGARSRTSEANWKLPLRWNRAEFVTCTCCGWRGEAEDRCFDAATDLSKVIPFCPICTGRYCFAPARRRVFCASLADVFDNEVDPAWRADLFALIRATPNLDWLLLTKRIGNATSMIAQAASALPRDAQCGTGQWNHSPIAQWPWPNVWLGATIVNQEEADRDIPKLLATPARVRFLSCEPLLGPISFRWQSYAHEATGQSYREYLDQNGGVNHLESLRKLDWVIAGGESGPHARPTHPQWFRRLRDQCEEASVPFLFKQWGEFVSVSEVEGPGAHYRFPDGSTVRRTGKKLAGRTLDGREHTAFPRSPAI